MSKSLKEINPKYAAFLEKSHEKATTNEYRFRQVLHALEHIIAGITLLVLIAALCMEVLHLVAHPAALSNVEEFLHSILTIVVGLEFVRMIIDTTPASILEVLTVAITRFVILSHDDPWSNVACIACIAGLFATRRFLIRRSELKTELDEMHEAE